MVEAAEQRDCGKASLEIRGTWNRLLVGESLVRTCLVEEAHLLGDDASKMFLAEDEDARRAFAASTGSFRTSRRSSTS
jgi:hypothetical protein